MVKMGKTWPNGPESTFLANMSARKQKYMHVVLAKVDEIVFEGDASSLSVPGMGGMMTILPEHMPLVTTLKTGEVTVHTQSGESKTVTIDGGILEVRRDGVTVIL